MKSKYFPVFLLCILHCLSSISIAGEVNNITNYDSLYRTTLNKNVFSSDSAKNILIKCISLSKKNHDSLNTIKYLLDLSYINRNNLNYVDAFDNNWDALILSENIKDSLFLAEAYQGLSGLYIIYNQADNAFMNIDKAIAINKKLLNSNKIQKETLLTNYYNALINSRVSMVFDSGLEYFDTCINLSNEINQDTIHKSYIFAEKGYIYVGQGKYKDAEDILLKVKTVFEEIVSDDPENRDDKGYLVFVYSFLGDLYSNLGSLNLSIEYYNKSLNAMDKYNTHNAIRSYILYNLALNYKEQKNYKLAYETMRESKNNYDGIFSIKGIKNFELLEIKNKYKEEIEKKNQEIYQNNILLSKKERTIFKVQILAFCLFFLIVISGLIVRNRTQNIRNAHEKDAIRRENLQKNKATRQLLEARNKELTTLTLQFIEKEKIISDLLENISNKKDLKELKSHLKLIKSNNNLWEEFNHRFNSVNVGFYDRLSEKFPNLSSTDLKHCALIKLNFSGKEMAHLLGISTSSVHISRHRLRKKMHLDRDINLSSFISHI